MARTDFPILKNVMGRMKKRKLRDKLVDGTIDATMLGIGDSIRGKVNDGIDRRTRRVR